MSSLVGPSDAVNGTARVAARPTPVPARVRWSRGRTPLIGLALPVLIVGLWQVGVSTGALKTAIASTPAQAAGTLWTLTTNGVLRMSSSRRSSGSSRGPASGWRPGSGSAS